MRVPSKYRKIASSLAALFAISLSASGGTQREVGSGRTYATIQSALTAAIAGDVINIHSGTYTEAITVAKTLMVKANTGEFPILVGYIRINADNVTIDGLEVKGWAATDTSALDGISQEGRTGLTVMNCKIHEGSGTGGPIDTGAVKNFTSAGIRLRNSTRTRIINNDIYGCVKGIRIQSAHSSDGTYANGMTISNNRIHDCPIDGVNLHGQYITVENNTIYDNMDLNFANSHPDGIQCIAATTDGYSSVQHVRIVRNTIYNHTQNVFTEGTTSGELSNASDILIANNVLFAVPGATVHGQPISSVPAPKSIMLKFSANVWAYNNTCLSENVCVHVQVCKDGTIHVKNNIFKGSNTGICVEDPKDVAAGELDYNDHFGNNNDVKWGSTFYATLLGFRAAVPTQSTHSVSSDPKINIGVQPTLQSGSPVIGKAVNLYASCPVDREGRSRSNVGSWDLGAYMAAGLAAPTNLVIIK